MITRARILVTRTRPGADKLVERLKRDGFSADSYPLLRAQYGPPASMQGDEQALILTSAHAVPAVPKNCQLPVLCVGQGTADVARRAGLRVAMAGSGGGVLLAREIIQRLDPGNGPLLWLHAKQARLELPQLLQQARFTVRDHVAYATMPVPQFSESLRTALQFGAFNAVVLQSPRAAAVFKHLCPPLDNPLMAFCYSDNVANALGKAGNLDKQVIPAPTEKQLLAMLKKEYPGLR